MKRFKIRACNKIKFMSAFLIGLSLMTACQMSEKKLRKLKSTTVIENPYEIKPLDPTEEENKKSSDFHNAGPTVVVKPKKEDTVAKSKETPPVTSPSKTQESKSTVPKQQTPAATLAQIEKETEALEKQYPFKVGERIEYRVRYFSLEAGVFTFEVKPVKQIQNRPVFHFYVSARTSSVFAWVYTLKDYAESFWDMKLKRPYLMKIYGEESRYLREVQTAFDWNKKQARYQAKIVEIGKGLDEEDKTWDLKYPEAQDVVSALYFLRTKNLEVGKTYDFRVAEMGKDILVRSRVIREEEIKTSQGKFMTYVVQPTFSVNNGAWKQNGDITLWLTKDENKIPIQFDAKIKVGTIKGRLHSLKR